MHAMPSFWDATPLDRAAQRIIDALRTLPDDEQLAAARAVELYLAARYDDPHTITAAGLVDDPLMARQPTNPDDLPNPRLWAARLTQAITETVLGFRPADQLRRHTTEAVYTQITEHRS